MLDGRLKVRCSCHSNRFQSETLNQSFSIEQNLSTLEIVCSKWSSNDSSPYSIVADTNETSASCFFWNSGCSQSIGRTSVAICNAQTQQSARSVAQGTCRKDEKAHLRYQTLKARASTTSWKTASLMSLLSPSCCIICPTRLWSSPSSSFCALTSNTQPTSSLSLHNKRNGGLPSEERMRIFKWFERV